MSTQLEEAQMSATQALEMLENEQLEKRHLEEEFSEISVSGGEEEGGSCLCSDACVAVGGRGGVRRSE